jgi:hypothetical protein
MAQLKRQNVVIQASVELVLDEEELRALDALAGYGTDKFLEFFYQHMGKTYLGPYENGLRRLFETVRGCAGLAHDAEDCRAFMKQTVQERARLIQGVRK